MMREGLSQKKTTEAERLRSVQLFILSDKTQKHQEISPSANKSKLSTKWSSVKRSVIKQQIKEHKEYVGKKEDTTRDELTLRRA